MQSTLLIVLFNQSNKNTKRSDLFLRKYKGGASFASPLENVHVDVVK